jgi:hypothetical protein
MYVQSIEYFSLKTYNFCLKHFDSYSVVSRVIVEAVRSRLPPQKPGFNPRAVHVGLVIDKVAEGQVLLQALVLRFPPTSHHSYNAVWATHLSPSLRCATGPTSQHVTTTSDIIQIFTSDGELDRTQIKEV